MNRRTVFSLTLVLLFALTGCQRDPKVAAKKYVEVGNKYFGRGRYRDASIMYRNALKKDLKYGDAYYRLALTSMKLGEIADAVHAFRRAIDLEPNNLDAVNTLADIYMAAYSTDSRHPKDLLDEASELSKRLEKKDPYNFERLNGYIDLINNNLPSALQRFQHANQLKPMQPGLVLVYFQALAAAGKFDEAEPLAKQLINSNKSFGPMYDSLYVEYVKRQRMQDAENILKVKIANNPKDGVALTQLAGYYFAARRNPDMLAVLQKITSNPTAFPNGNMVVGNFYFRIGNFDEASRYYEEGARNASSAADRTSYQKRIIETLLFQGKRLEASQLVEAILKQDPNDLDAKAMQASLLIQMGKREDIQKAINELQAVVTRMPENPVLRYNLGRAYLAKGDVDQAKLQFQEAIKLRADYLPPRLVLAQLLLLRSEFGTAMQAAADILSFDPNNVVARLIHSSALIGVGDNAKARAELLKTVAENPSSHDAIFQFAMLNLRDRMFKEADEGFRKLTTMDPPDTRGTMGLAEVEIAQGHFDQALAIYQNELQRDPSRSDIRVALANTAVRAQKYDLAISQYQQLIQQFPKQSGLFVRLAETFRRKGDIQSAIHYFQAAKDLDPTNVTPPMQLAMLYEQIGRKDQAIPIYQQILKIQPDNPIALNNLAFQMAESGNDLDEALTFAQRAKNQMPQNPDISDTLGWIYIKKNLSDSAIGIFRDLVTRYPNQPTFRYHLAMALYQKGDRPQAKKELETALTKSPSDSDRVKIRDLMARIG